MLKKFLSTPRELGKLGRFVFFQLNMWRYCAKLLKKNRCGQQAAALSYRTLFGIVPLAIVMLLIFQSFPASSNISDEFKDFVYKQAHLTGIEYTTAEGQAINITEKIDQFVDSFFTGLNTGGITIVSGLVVIWAALGLLMTIETAFNNIWHVTRGRNMLSRIVNYWALLTLGPLTIGAGIYLSTAYRTADLVKLSHLSYLTPLLPYFVSVIVFFVMYELMPNTRVKALAAIWGAMVAALVWTLAKWGFGMYVTRLMPYAKVYGVMGLFPLTVFWIYITWLIILFGLQLTFTTQHLKTLNAAEIAATKEQPIFIANDLTVINIARLIAEFFEQNNAPLSADVICSKLNIPAEFTEKILNQLVEKHIILKTTDPVTGFVPATTPENIKLSDITAAISPTEPTTEENRLSQIANSQQNSLAQHSLKEIL